MSYSNHLYTPRTTLSSTNSTTIMNGLPAPTEDSNIQSQSYSGSQQAFNQLTVPQTNAQSSSTNGIDQQMFSGSNTAPPSAGSSITSTNFNGSEKGLWMDSKDFDSPRTEQPSFAQKSTIRAHSPNYVANVPYSLSSFPSTSSFTSQQEVQQHYQQYQQQQHHPQQLMKPMLSSQFKFPEPTDSVLPSSHDFNHYLSSHNHHHHHPALPQPSQIPQLSMYKHYMNGSIPNGLDLPSSQLDQKFDELLTSSKQLTRKRSKNNKLGISKPGHQDEFICEHCGKVFAKNYNLKSHLKTHSDEKPFTCSFCSRSFARNHDRKRHELLHQGIKRFQCGGILKDNVTRWGCGKRFSRADGLSRHFKTDIGWLCVRPLMLEAKQSENNGSSNSQELDQNLSTNLDINFINELIKRK